MPRQMYFSKFEQSLYIWQLIISVGPSERQLAVPRSQNLRSAIYYFS